MIELLIPSRRTTLGGQAIGRVLPWRARRSVGPFVFLDHMGPAELAPGERFDVPPHPHIGLSTLTLLFEGSSVHRDSLGFVQTIRPGDINWMTAGRGIVHSERSPPEAPGGTLHGLQLWVALPREREDSEPSFEHHPAASLPVVSPAGARLSICCGSAYGATSAVQVSAPLFFVDASLEAGATLELPPEHAERALYLVEGTVEVFGQTVEARTMIVFGSGPAPVRATTKARAVLLGGAPLDGPRHMWWNFVSSSPEKIEQAKRDWHLGRFAPIPGDDQERTPLP